MEERIDRVLHPTMASTALILFISAIALGLAWSLLFHNSQPKSFTVADWEKKKWEIDVRVFNYLVDRNEERYLALALVRKKFLVYQRRRTQLALRIVQLAKENSEMLVRMGALARDSNNPLLVREADDLIAAATQLRLNLMLAKYCLWVKWLFPTWSVSVPSVQTRYEHLLDFSLHFRQHRCQS